MKNTGHALAFSLIALALGSCGDAPEDVQTADEQPAPAVTPTQPAAAPAAAPAAGDTPLAEAGFAAKVNDFEITNAAVEERVLQIVLAQTQGRGLPPQNMIQARASLRPQVISELIDEQLLDEDAARVGVEETIEEVVAEMELSIAATLLLQGISREELAERVPRDGGQSFDEYLASQAEDPQLRRMTRHAKLVTGTYADEFVVSDEEVAGSYESELETVFTQPETVRASHILLGAEESAPPEQRQGARDKAESVLALARLPEADFAALAREHSTGPSAPSGGDLNFFPREGAMVEPFAAAAFALEVGGVSEVVETQFGYHVIKCTDRRDARVITLAEATDMIRARLEREKLAELRAKHVEKLRAEAVIEQPGE